MKEIKRYLVTSALPYANGPLHIGHLAGAYLSADVYVRFMRLYGKDIRFICGSDEHGAAITIKALKEKVSPEEVVNKYHALFKDSFEKIGISFDIYHRTSSQLHHDTSREFFLNLYNKGEFSVREIEQYYDPKAEQFLADRYITGTCPSCGSDKAFGDQCENCGTSLSPTELINPKSTLSDAIPELRLTKHWFLPLDKYETWLKEWMDTGELDGEKLHYPEDWKNHVLGQCRSWLENGLQPRAMTRDLNWGVDLPSEVPDSEGKKLYVWMDAPIGYISATRQWAEDHKTDWKKYWQDEETALIHFIGKDNIVFHCIIFPAILKAHGDYILPKNIPANQFMNLEGDKISTSRNWAVWVHEYLENYPDKVDELRYVLIKNMPEQKDSEFTWKSYQDAVNNELVNNLGNFINRVLVLVNKYYKGVVPEIDEDLDITGCESEEDISFHDAELLRLFDNIDLLCAKIRKFDFRAALKVLMEISSNGNQILQFNAPWKNVKEDPEQVKVVMHLLLQYLAALSVTMKPFMPFTADKLRDMLNLSPLDEKDELLELCNKLSEDESLIPAGHKIAEAEHLFSRIEDEMILTEMDKLLAHRKDNAKELKISGNNIKDSINHDDFVKMDLRAATIIAADKIKKADKLLELTLDLGFEKRTVVSGIAEFFKPEEVVGQRVTLLANLEARKIRGVKSQGMILMSENNDGSLHFVQPAEGCENGAIIS